MRGQIVSLADDSLVKSNTLVNQTELTRIVIKRIGIDILVQHSRIISGDLFALKDVKNDDSVSVFVNKKEFDYQVVSVKIVGLSDSSTSTNDETLILYTGFGLSDSKKLVVTAKRVIN